MVTSDSLLSAVHLEFDRNVEFRLHAAELLNRLRAVGVTLPSSDRDALSAQLEDGRLLGKAALDDYLARCSTPQWMQARNCEAARTGFRR
jgi:hypothetical protein